MRGRRPAKSKQDDKVTLNYNGRVKQSSKKNMQCEMKFNTDGKIRVVF